MADFTYSGGTSDRDQVRLLIADTKAAHAYYSDTEVDSALSVQGSVEGAVYQLAAHAYAAALRNTSSRSMSSQGGSKAIDDTHTVEGWKALMDAYRPFATAAKRLPTVSVFTSHIPSDDGWEAL